MIPAVSRKVYSDPAAMSRAVAEHIVALAVERVSTSGRCSIALSGGATPLPTYALLASAPFVKQMPWAKTRIYFGDERHVPPDHADSNYRAVNDALLKEVPLPPENVFPIPTEHEEPAACAEWYEDLLRMHYQRQPDRFPSLDLLMLGLGADGHTAGLFPGTPAVAERERWVTWCDPVAANPAVTPAVKRITLTAPVIWQATNVFVLATGAAKAPVVAAVCADAPTADPPPARLLKACHGAVTFFLDKAAAGQA